MIARLRRYLWARQLSRRVGDPALVEPLIALGVIAARLSGDRDKPRLDWPDDHISTDLAQERFFLDAAIHLPPLRRAGARWSRTSDGRLRLDVGGVALAPGSAEEILIASEIFHDGVYNLDFARPAVVLDIGANVATSALAFARSPRVARVYAYEPLPDNLSRARANLALNPSLAPCIELPPWALGAHTRTQQMEYDPAWRGSASLLRGPAEITRLHSAATKRVDIDVRPATDAVDEIMAAHPGVDLWAKIDCEGAEDEIMPALATSGRLARLRGLVMETHCGNGLRQELILAQAGFTVWRPEPGSTDLGYLLAFRSE